MLCLGAHCDDIEIGCGGTLLRLVASRTAVEVHWQVFSGAGSEREAEARECASLFLQGAAACRVIVRGFRDGFFPYAGAEIKQEFEELRGAFAPDVIFTHHRGDIACRRQVFRREGAKEVLVRDVHRLDCVAIG